MYNINIKFNKFFDGCESKKLIRICKYIIFSKKTKLLAINLFQLNYDYKIKYVIIIQVLCTFYRKITLSKNTHTNCYNCIMCHYFLKYPIDNIFVIQYQIRKLLANI